MFLMMGTFHIILNYLAVISTRFKDAGLRDIIVQSMIVAEGSVDTMFSGTRAYKRAVRVYKILYEAIFRLLLEEYEANNPNCCEKMDEYIQNLDEASNFNTMLENIVQI